MNDADRGLFEGGPEALFALAQLHLRQLAFGDVLNDAAHLQQLPMAIEFEPALSMDPADCLIGTADDAVFLVEGLSRAHNVAGKIRRHHFAVVGMDHLQPSGKGVVIGLVDAEDSVQRLRACPFLRGQIQYIAAEGADNLRFLQRIEAFAQRFLGLPALGYVVHDGADQRPAIHFEGR